jgi:hypothetical protein
MKDDIEVSDLALWKCSMIVIMSFSCLRFGGADVFDGLLGLYGESGLAQDRAYLQTVRHIISG